ncbi:hypothetical protein LDENG_00280740 [Lucifuga dentata]|nr:hypothetical protein LDENG_00280740 [Lucifuga dentata]
MKLLRLDIYSILSHLTDEAVTYIYLYMHLFGPQFKSIPDIIQQKNSCCFLKPKSLFGLALSATTHNLWLI